MNKKDFYFQHVIHTVQYDVAFNPRIIDESTYMIYPKELHNMTNMLVNLELKYTQEAI